MVSSFPTVFGITGRFSRPLSFNTCYWGMNLFFLLYDNTYSIFISVDIVVFSSCLSMTLVKIELLQIIPVSLCTYVTGFCVLFGKNSIYSMLLTLE